jgi:regulatory protein
LKPTVQQLSLRGRALKYLSAREHSRAELAKRLADGQTDPEDIRALLDDLQAKGFISDERRAEALLNRRAPKLGNLLLKKELTSAGLSREITEKALKNLGQSDAGNELDRATQVRAKRFGESLPVDLKDKARQVRFLASRGFGAEVIQQVLKPPASA